MDEELQKELKALRRSLLINRILNGVLLAFMLVLLISGIRVTKKVLPMMEEVGQISATMEEIGKLDLVALSDSVNSIDDQLSAVDWDMVMAQIEAIDVEAFNDGLNTIRGIDVDALGKAIDNLNSVMNALKSLPFF
ncbi:MAG: hypothetical protein K5891_08245 [Lachnospiraceae bacterium]|nr:hypothetical protein [Lachnospiraceae bacterium]